MELLTIMKWGVILYHAPVDVYLNVVLKLVY
jgi:hypothetical protein